LAHPPSWRQQLEEQMLVTYRLTGLVSASCIALLAAGQMIVGLSQLAVGTSPPAMENNVAAVSSKNPAPRPISDDPVAARMSGTKAPAQDAVREATPDPVQKLRDGKLVDGAAHQQVAARTNVKPPDASAEARAFADAPRIALLINNMSYLDADPPLNQIKTDVHALANELEQLGFKTEIAENLTTNGLRSAVDNFVEKLKPGATALFFFSGYALQADRQTYLLPTDAEIWRDADIVRYGSNLETILAKVDGRGAAVKLAVVDAARKNPYERRFRSVAAGLAPISVPRDSLVIYSTSVGQAGEQSLFMSALLKELRCPGISVEEMFARTRIGVARASKARQVPWVASSLVENVYFAKREIVAAQPLM
jgi:hypothetical protein